MTQPDSIVVSDLSIGYSAAEPIARHINFSVAAGQALFILGPNGAGKTTLLRTLLGLNEPLAGSVSLAGRDARTCSRRERARLLAYVPQARRFEFSFRVLDLVAMGSAPRLSRFAMPTRTDYELAARALAWLGIEQLAQAEEAKLSGGEQQLVMIARALVQQTPFLLLDEPTAHLDFSNQARVLAQIGALAQAGLGIIMISHSPAHAFACATHAALLGRHGELEVGTVDEMLTESRLSRIYELPVRVVSVDTPRGPLRTCLPDPQ